MPLGPWNVSVAPAVMGGVVLVMPQTGSGFTFSNTSFVVKVFAHRLESVTIRRIVAMAGAPVRITVVVNELVLVMDAGPDTTDQFVPVVLPVPGVTVPVSVKLLVGPSVHLV